HGFHALHNSVQGRGHPRDGRMSDSTLHVPDLPTAVSLVPGAVELLGGPPELHDEVAGQVLRLGLPPLLAPEPDKSCFIAAHDDAGIRAADERAAANILQEFRADFWHCCLREASPMILKVSSNMDDESIPKVSIRQIKAARALLGWSQEHLAAAAGISTPTIKRLEASDGPLGGRSETADKIRTALERGGVEFIDENGGGLGVRARK